MLWEAHTPALHMVIVAQRVGQTWQGESEAASELLLWPLTMVLIVELSTFQSKVKLEGLPCPLHWLVVRPPGND
jgi:hypothetical protein